MSVVKGEKFRQVQLMAQPQHLSRQQLLPCSRRQLREERQDGVEAQIPAAFSFHWLSRRWFFVCECFPYGVFVHATLSNTIGSGKEKTTCHDLPSG